MINRPEDRAAITETVENTEPEEAVKEARELIVAWQDRGWTIENVLTVDKTNRSLTMTFTASPRNPVYILTVSGCMSFGDGSEMTAAALQIIKIATHGIEPWVTRARRQIEAPSNASTLRIVLSPAQ